MSSPTGTVYPGTLDTGTSIGSAVSSGQVIASAYVDTSSSAILAIEGALGTNPQGSDASVSAALAARVRKTDVQNQTLTYADDTGTANTYAVALSPALSAYAEGQVVVFKAGHANTGASTLNVNSLGAQSLVKNGSTALASGDINAGEIYTALFDGVNFQVAGGIGFGTITLTGDVAGSGAGSIATTLANSGVTAGTYPKVTVNAKGLATAGTTLSPSDIPSGYTGGSSIATVGTITTGTWQGTGVAVGYGGTGASTAAGARSNLGAAASGANSDITSLSGITSINTNSTIANTGEQTITASGNTKVPLTLNTPASQTADYLDMQANGANVFSFSSGGSSAQVNGLAFTSAATGAAPTISAGGSSSDATLNLSLNAKGATNNVSVDMGNLAITAGALLLGNVNPQSANYTVNSGSALDSFITVTTGSSSITVTFPTAAAGNKGQVVVVAKADTGAGSVTWSGTLTIPSNLSSQGQSQTFISDGSNGWYAIA